jgi:Toastrack DUF4097
MHRSWLAALVWTAAFLTTACGIQAAGNGVDGSFDRTITLDGPADVSVTSRSGSIHVTAGTSNQIQIAARIRAFGSFTYSPSEQVDELEAAPPVRQHGNSIAIGEIDDTMLGSNVTISYDITVPSDARLRTSSRSGMQTLTALRGPLDAVSRSGNIRLEDVKAALRLGTRSGDVTVEGEPTGQWDIETRSGDIDLRTNDSSRFDVDVRTYSGSIRTSRAIELSGVQRRKQFRGRVNGGGTPVVVDTRSGSIDIR